MAFSEEYYWKHDMETGDEIDLTELHKLGDYLESHGYFYKYDFFGNQIVLYKDELAKEHNVRWFDVVCHRNSYGHEHGLLESYGVYITERQKGHDDTVRGYLTADDVIKYLEAPEEEKARLSNEVVLCSIKKDMLLEDIEWIYKNAKEKLAEDVKSISVEEIFKGSYFESLEFHDGDYVIKIEKE